MGNYVLLFSNRPLERLEDWTRAGTLARFSAPDDARARDRALQELGRRSYQPATAWGRLHEEGGGTRTVARWVLGIDGLWEEEPP